MEYDNLKKEIYNRFGPPNHLPSFAQEIYESCLTSLAETQKSIVQQNKFSL